MISLVKFDRKDTALFAGSSERSISYRELGEWVEKNRQLLGRLPRPTLAFQFSPNSAAGVAAYLGCLAERIPLGLGEPALELRQRVIAAYRPNALILPASYEATEGYKQVGKLAGAELILWQSHDGRPLSFDLNPALALLLATSGSTGDPKYVRLSLSNLEANARSIAQYLALGPAETAIQSLPMNYSYGLSIINSHLLAGGAVAITGHSFMRPEFWRITDECGCTSFAGVPYMYEILHRLRTIPTARRTIRTLTQAGGHLRVDLVRYFQSAAASNGARLFVMYGQTEATARIAYVPPERLLEKIGSIGVAIPDGKLCLEPADGESTQKQLIYRGPNVMLGYATGPADLARGDEQGGLLATGDIAECDADGFFRLTGRLGRIAKLFGKRINLASVEAEIEGKFPLRAAVLDCGDQLRIFIEGESQGEAVRSYLAGLLGVTPQAIKIVFLDRLPMTISGKKDYKALK